MSDDMTRPSGGNGDARADDSRQLDLEHDAIDPRLTNLPAQIDQVKRQVDEARDITAVWEIRNKAEALKTYAKKHGGLVEAHNRLASIIALAERKIGIELRKVELNKGCRPPKTCTEKEHVSAPKVAELGFTRKQSADFQEMADVESEVLLGAVAKAGADGREVTKKDIRSAVKEHLGKAPKTKKENPSTANVPQKKRKPPAAVVVIPGHSKEYIAVMEFIRRVPLREMTAQEAVNIPRQDERGTIEKYFTPAVQWVEEWARTWRQMHHEQTQVEPPLDLVHGLLGQVVVFQDSHPETTDQEILAALDIVRRRVEDGEIPDISAYLRAEGSGQ